MSSDYERGGLNVTSEIGSLKAVLLHRPGNELERLTPEYLKELLFDDIPWLKTMQQEHGNFASTMERWGTEVFYVDKLLAEVLEDKSIREEFVKDVIQSCNIGNQELEQDIYDYIINKYPEEITKIVIAGLHKDDVPEMSKGRELSLVDYIRIRNPFYINPLPNLYFTRDPGTVISKGLSINSMRTEARRRESMFLNYIYKYHDIFGRKNTPLWYQYTNRFSIEGGDILVLSKEVIAIGCSERTSARAIEELARNIFDGDGTIKEILVIQIPFVRAYMHLDTVFTMVDYDKFTIFPGVQGELKTYSLTRGKVRGLHAQPEEGLEKALKRVLKVPAIKFIETGGGHPITAAREQWNDGTNTLAIAPGVVITYDRNEASNECLAKNGIEVVTINGAELVRGRGGPRCMSMPLVREDI